jgi:hypothetical protein
MEKNLDKLQLQAEMRQRLKDIYYEDIVKLQELLKRDLSLWLYET